MNGTGGRLHFEATMTNDDLIRKMRENRQAIVDSGRTAESEGAKITQMFKTAAAAAVGFFTIQQAKNFASDIIRVRSEMQMMEASFETLLQSAPKAAKMIAEMREFALQSPLELTHVTNAAQTLIGFGVDAEKTMDILRQLGDVSMGNSDRFQRLALVYAQTQAAGKLMGQDLLQMINAGFNPLQVISEKTGKSIGELKDMMSNGAISAEMVADAFKTVTEEGGKFYGMTQKQAEGIAGLKASLQDAFVDMYNKIGESQEGVIVSGYKMATSIVENYETIGRMLGVLIAGYGSYRTALIAVAAAQKAVTISGNISAWFELAKGIRTAKDAQVALNLAMGANPILKIVSLIIAAGTALYLFSRKTNDAEKELTGLAKASKNAGEEFDKESSKVKALQDIMNNSKVVYDERKRALNELKTLIPQYNGELTKEGTIINNNTNAIKEYLVQLERQIKLKAAQEELEAAYRQQRKDLRDAEEQIRRGADVYIQGFQGSVQASGTRAYTSEEADILRRNAIDKTKDVISELNTEIEATALASDRLGSGIRTFSEQLTASATKVKTLKSELKDLLAGKGEEADFATAIENKKKELKTAEDSYNTLLGIDKSTIKAGKEANQLKVENAERLRKIEEYKKSVFDATKKAEFEIRQAAIEAMDDGFEKRKAQIDLNYRKLIAENRDRMNQMLEDLQKAERIQWEAEHPDFKEKGLIFKSTLTVDDLSAEQHEILAGYVDAANAYLMSATKKSHTEILDNFQTFADKYNAIAKKLEKDKAEIRAAGGTSEQEAEAEFQAKKAIEAVDAEVAARSQEFKKFLDDIAGMQLYYLEKKLKGIRESAAIIESTGTDEEKAMLRQQIKVLEEQIRAERANLSKGSKDPLERWKNTEKVLRGVSSSLSDLGKNFTGVAGEAFQAATTMAAGTISMISGIAELGNWAARATQMAAQGASAAIIAAEKASVILTIISAALQVVNVLVGDESAEAARKNALEARRLSGYWESINGQVSQYIKLLEQAAGVDYFATVQKTNNALNEGLEKSKKSVLDFKSGEVEAIEMMLFRLKAGVKVKLPMESKQDYEDSLKIWELIKDSNLESYRALRNNADLWSKIPGWMQEAIDQAISYAEQIDEINQKLNEDLLQTTTKGIEDAIKDWLKSSKDGIDDVGTYFEDTMRNALLESFVIDQLRGKIKEWYNQYALLADSNDDGRLDLTQDDINALRESWNNMVEWAKTESDTITSVLGNTPGLSKEASKRGFLAMNQDTGDELNGRFTDMQGKMGDIRDVAIDLRGLAIISVGHLSNIDKNTKHLSLISEGIEQIKKNTANL